MNSSALKAIKHTRYRISPTAKIMNAYFSSNKTRLFARDPYSRLKRDTQYVRARARIQMRVAVYVTAAAARKSGTHGFGDGDACRSNGCAPPGPTKPASIGIGVEALSSTKGTSLKKGLERRGGYKRTL